MLALYYFWLYLSLCIIINSWVFLICLSFCNLALHRFCLCKCISTGNVNRNAWVCSTFLGCTHPHSHLLICVGFTIMLCYCFVSIFATVLALPFSFHPPFSSCALPEQCGLTETIPRDIAIYSSVTVYNLSGNMHRLERRQHRDTLLHVLRGFLESSIKAGGFWVRAWVQSFWALLLLLCRTGQVRLSPLAPDYIQHKGVACEVSLGKGLWAPKFLEEEEGKGLCQLYQQIYIYLCMWNTMGQRWSCYGF